jgi:methylenetetrahydrofolate reductase (NADPH)
VPRAPAGDRPESLRQRYSRRIATIPEILERHDRPVFSFEFFPPKTPAGSENLNRALEDLQVLAPDFVSVTYGAGGSTRHTTVELVAHIKQDLGLEAMAHLTCVNATIDEVRATLDRMRGVGIDNVLALRGDPPRGQERWTKTDGGLEYSQELVALIRAEYDFTVAGAAFPETHIHAVSPEEDLRHLKTKVDLGVEVLITQMFLDNAYYFDFVRRVREIGIDVPIIPGVMPILSLDGMKRMAELTAADVPKALDTELERRRGDDLAIAELGVSYATLQCADLLAGGAPGIHFITLNRSSATRAILSALRLMKPWETSVARRPPEPRETPGARRPPKPVETPVARRPPEPRETPVARRPPEAPGTPVARRPPEPS